jgi:hypothetical protein
MIEREHREAVALMNWVRFRVNQYPALRWFHHIPNGGARSKAAAGKLKAEGTKRGISDYSWPHPRGGYHGLYIELKAPGGRPTPEQNEFLEFAREQGFRAEVAVGWEAAKDLIEEYLGMEEANGA